MNLLTEISVNAVFLFKCPVLKTPKHNGLPQTMLIDANLPKKFWVDVADTATFVIGRLLTPISMVISLLKNFL